MNLINVAVVIDEKDIGTISLQCLLATVTMIFYSIDAACSWLWIYMHDRQRLHVEHASYFTVYARNISLGMFKNHNKYSKIGDFKPEKQRGIQAMWSSSCAPRFFSQFRWKRNFANMKGCNLRLNRDCLFSVCLQTYYFYVFNLYNKLLFLRFLLKNRQGNLCSSASRDLGERGNVG